MLHYDALWHCLAEIGLQNWRAAVEPLLRQRFSHEAHGDFTRWQQTLEELRSVSPQQPDALRSLLLALSPWRKGPFSLGGVTIDSEWRSDLKWDRLKNAIEPLHGRNVVDIGCGNGYYALRMHAAGASAVIGVDPTILYAMQFLAVSHFQPAPRVFVLPLRSDELPQDAHAFDTCFSMGVLYHQRSPLLHLQQLRGLLRSAGQLVLETLFIPGEEPCARTPPDRYARMRNVWLLPTLAELTTWLRRSGFGDIDIVSTTVTGSDEQRTTEWMPFESLSAALDPADPSKTIEGWPAPRRVIVLAKPR